MSLSAIFARDESHDRPVCLAYILDPCKTWTAPELKSSLNFRFWTWTFEIEHAAICECGGKFEFQGLKNIFFAYKYKYKYKYKYM